MNILRFAITIVLVLVTALFLSLPAASQNALGDGRALDANLGTDSGGRNPIAPQPDFRLRNLLVTGNVTGGRGFRGTVGYTAAEDFRDETGSDTLFGFERDAAMSSLSYIRLGRSFSPLAVGRDFGVIEFHRPSVGTTLESITPPSFDPEPEYGEFFDAQARLDRILLSQRSQAGIYDIESRPMTIELLRTEEGEPFRLTSTPTRGLRITPLDPSDVTALGLTVYDQARILEDQLEGRQSPLEPGRPYEEDFGDRRLAQGQLDSGAIDTRVTPSHPRDYEAIIEEVSERYAQAAPAAPPTEVASAVGEEMDRLTRWMQGEFGEDAITTEEGEQEAEAEDAAPTTTPPTPPGVPQLPDPTELIRPKTPEIPDPVLRGERQKKEPIDLPADFNLEILRHGRTIERLSPEEAADRFNEIMQEGEARIAAGEYFLAERLFDRALRFKPDHPLALAGILSARVGAGVQASAGLSARQLFTRHPQMIDVQYGPEVMPGRNRLLQIAAGIRERVTRDRAGSESALLLAWIGRQIEDRDMMVEGIELMERYDSADPLVPVLRAVWLGEEVERSDAGGDAGDEADGGIEPPGD